MASRKLEVQIVGDASKLNKAFGQAGNSASGFGSKMAKVGKIAAVGLAAGVGLAAVAAVKFAKAALEAEKSQTRLDAAFKHAGASAKEQAAALKRVSDVSNQAGLDDEALADSLARLTQVTGDVTKAQNAMALAADVARGRGVSLEAATQLVTKAAIGQVGALKRMGIAIPAVTTAVDALKESNKKATSEQMKAAKAADLVSTKQAALAALQSKFGGDAEAYGKTASGAMDRFKVAIENVEEGLGQALLPTLGRVAGGVADFLTKFNEAKGASDKFKVVLEGVKKLGEDIVVALKTAVGSIDWVKVWGSAQGIGAGLAARMASVDWSEVGAKIGDGISAGIGSAGEIGKKIASAVAEANRSIDWESVGRAAGPGLAQAVATAIKTALDPAFWVRNWDLALAVAITAFTGPIGKVVGKLAGPLAKVGGDMVITIAAAVSKFSPAIGEALLVALLKLPALVAGALGKLTSVVSSVFPKLGRLAVFTVKVLGIQAVINAIANMATDVYNKLRELIGRASSAAREIGAAIVSGIVAGVQSLPGVLADKLKGMLGGALSAAKAFVQAKSPSQLFASEVGSPIALGIAMGVKSAGPKISEELQKSLENAIERAKQVMEAKRASFGQAWDTFASAAGSAFDAVYDKIQTKSEKALAKLQKTAQEASLKGAITDARSGLSEAQAGGDPAAIVAAQKALDDALRAQQEYTLQQRAIKERLELDATIARKRENFDKQLLSLQTHLTKEGATQRQAHTALMKLFDKFGLDYEKSGAALGQAFADGLTSKVKAVEAAAVKLAEAASKPIRLKSPAEVGPLSQLDTFWKSFVPTLTSGLDFGGLGRAVSGAVSLPSAAPSPGGGGGSTINITVNGWVGNDQDIAARIQQELVRYGRRNTSIFTGPGVTA